MNPGTYTKRIIKAGLKNFWRNGVVSFTSVIMMVVTLLMVAGMIFTNAILNFSLQQIEERVDINAYFYPEVVETDILALKDGLEALPEVREVQYVSREQALADFTERHAKDYLALQALQELGENPLGAALNIKANDSSQYDSIAKFFEDKAAGFSQQTNFVEKINYYQNKEIIDRLTKLMGTMRQLGLVLAGVFIVISVLITLNTLRLAMYVAREEISIMRLVGAENKYIKGPFIVVGALYGLIATLLTLGILYPVTRWVTKHTVVFFGGMDVSAYYINNLVSIILILSVVGIILGVFSSMLAIRRYLRK